jgi:hypothetical protein
VRAHTCVYEVVTVLLLLFHIGTQYCNLNVSCLHSAFCGFSQTLQTNLGYLTNVTTISTHFSIHAHKSPSYDNTVYIITQYSPYRNVSSINLNSQRDYTL